LTEGVRVRGRNRAVARDGDVTAPCVRGWCAVTEEVNAGTVRGTVRVAAGWSVAARGPVQPVLRGSGVDGAALWRDAERLLRRGGKEGLGIGLSNESGSNRGVSMLCVCASVPAARGACVWRTRVNACVACCG
jgi:hypothetical protein